MSLDGMALRALSQELHSRLAGGRVDKITQPGERDLVIHIRVAGKTERVLFSINPQNARLTLSQKTDPGLREATLFCMVLRKHLMNAQLLAVTQQGYERMVHLDFTGRNEIGDETQLTLIAELMGRSSNIILVNSEGLILDAMRRVGSGTNKYRQIQPGLAYVPPPAQDKKAIDDLADGDLSALILANESNKNMRNLLVQILAGIGPQTAEDLLLKSSIDPDGTA
ncbi:MAG: NFACT family protein, partial [Peptococcus niger]